MTPHQPLRGQKALVTGANSGIGEGVARALAAAGADVVVNYVAHQEAADRLVAELKTHGVAALAIRADVSSEAEVRGMFEEMLAAWGTIDVLVSNAGLQRDAPLVGSPCPVHSPIGRRPGGRRKRRSRVPSAPPPGGG